jgi:RpiR family transcriptional regulator, carbohydrate utilization regulator
MLIPALILFCIEGRSHMPSRSAYTEFVPSDINTMLSGLYSARQDMIRPVLEHPRSYILLNIRELASRLQVDPATVSRTVFAMGFPSYREFQRYLHQLSVAHTTALDQMKATKKHHTTFSSRLQETLKSAMENLEGLVNSLDPDRLDTLAARFYKAKRIVILGGDLAECLVSFLHYQLTVLNFHAIPATHAGHATHLMRGVTKDDLVVAISFRRGLRQTVEGLLQARAHGCYCVGITDTSISRIARSSDETFIVSIDTPPFGPSYVAAMALLDAILSAVVNHRRPRTLAILKEAEKEQRTGHRWDPEL